MAMIEIDDRPVGEHDGRDLLEDFRPLRRVARGAGAIEQLVHSRFAVARIVERLLAAVKAVQVAIGIGPSAPREHVGFILATVRQVE